MEQYPDSQIDLTILGYIPNEIRQNAIINNLSLVIQGENDRFASPSKIKELVNESVEVVAIINADHSYRNEKKEPIYQGLVIKELLEWTKRKK